MFALVATDCRRYMHTEISFSLHLLMHSCNLSPSATSIHKSQCNSNSLCQNLPIMNSLLVLVGNTFDVYKYIYQGFEDMRNISSTNILKCEFLTIYLDIRVEWFGFCK